MRGHLQSSDQVERKASLTPWKSIFTNSSIELFIAQVREKIKKLSYFRRGFWLSSDWASRQFSTVAWLAKCKILWVSTRNHSAIHQYRQIKANSISIASGQDCPENWTLYFCAYRITGNVTVNSSEPDCFQKVGLSFARFEWPLKFLSSWTKKCLCGPGHTSS